MNTTLQRKHWNFTFVGSFNFVNCRTWNHSNYWCLFNFMVYLSTDCNSQFDHSSVTRVQIVEKQMTKKQDPIESFCWSHFAARILFLFSRHQLCQISKCMVFFHRIHHSIFVYLFGIYSVLCLGLIDCCWPSCWCTPDCWSCSHGGFVISIHLRQTYSMSGKMMRASS